MSRSRPSPSSAAPRREPTLTSSTPQQQVRRSAVSPSSLFEATLLSSGQSV
jgi:hypothetical protein